MISGKSFYLCTGCVVNNNNCPLCQSRVCVYKNIVFVSVVIRGQCIKAKSTLFFFDFLLSLVAIEVDKCFR